MLGPNLAKPYTLSKKDKEKLADFLKIDLEAFQAFECAYQKHALSDNVSGDNLFDINSRQAANLLRQNNSSPDSTDKVVYIKNLVDRIVDELIDQTERYVFDGTKGCFEKLQGDIRCLVSLEEINALPKELRPQLSGRFMKKDFHCSSWTMVLDMYSRALKAKKESEKNRFYGMFRQGLDILDLDPILYEIIGKNQNSIGHWFPQLVEACKHDTFFKLPATTIIKVPIPLLQLTRCEYSELTPTTLAIVDKYCSKVFELCESKDYFIKTGTYSSKFDFRNAFVHGEKEVRELGEYLLFIHYQALQMASPLSKPCVYGVSTTNEWVVREFVHDKENNPKIYKGLPLHTEYRLFVDFDSREVLGCTPYWDSNLMKNRFSQCPDANSPHQIHDFVVFEMYEDILMQRYNQNVEKVKTNIQRIIPEIQLTGQWSIDVMQNGEDFWIIDMAKAESSALNCIPENLRKKESENWIPSILK